MPLNQRLMLIKVTELCFWPRKDAWIYINVFQQLIKVSTSVFEQYFWRIFGICFLFQYILISNTPLFRFEII